MNRFSFFLQSIHSTSNVVVSPFSIVALLALLQQGALGETQRQITTTLQMNPDYSAASFKTFLDDIQVKFVIFCITSTSEKNFCS